MADLDTRGFRMSRHGKVTAPLLGRPKVGQHVTVRRRIRGPVFYGDDQFRHEQGVVELVRKSEVIVRSVYGYELTVAPSELRALVKNFSKRWTTRRWPR